MFIWHKCFTRWGSEWAAGEGQADVSGRAVIVPPALGHNISEITAHFSGMPQGSVLGSILLVLFLLKFGDILHNLVAYRCYNDYIQLHVSFKTGIRVFDLFPQLNNQVLIIWYNWAQPGNCAFLWPAPSLYYQMATSILGAGPAAYYSDYSTIN